MIRTVETNGFYETLSYFLAAACSPNRIRRTRTFVDKITFLRTKLEVIDTDKKKK